MSRIVGISFVPNGKIYNFKCNDIMTEINDEVIVETEKGLQYGFDVTDFKEINEKDYNLPLRDVIRIAGKRDRSIYDKNIRDAERALNKAREIVDELGLTMHLIDANFTFNREQLIFNFTSDDRVDFRELAKRLAQIYKTRIELRQIGIRDKAKEVGGIGPCGMMLCCNTFLKDITGVSINMAKNQNLSLNPTKINGVCGRLLCCLSYEDDTYKKARENLPNIGDYYKSKDVNGKVVDLNILNNKIYVETENKGRVCVDLNDEKNK